MDETSEVFEKGQPAEREQELDAQYERAYRGVEDPLGKDFAKWENEGVWPPELREERTRMKITVQKNGPFRVEGDDIQLTDPQGGTYGLGGRTVVSLCRCGASQNKPFCDGSHNHHGFQDEPQARDLPPKKV